MISYKQGEEAKGLGWVQQSETYTSTNRTEWDRNIRCRQHLHTYVHTRKYRLKRDEKMRESEREGENWQTNFYTVFFIFYCYRTHPKQVYPSKKKKNPNQKHRGGVFVSRFSWSIILPLQTCETYVEVINSANWPVLKHTERNSPRRISICSQTIQQNLHDGLAKRNPTNFILCSFSGL